MDPKTILEELRAQFGKQSVLFAEDIAELIGADHPTVKKIGAGLGIPLPLKKVGNRYGISIYAIADWLASADAPKKAKGKRQFLEPLAKPKKIRPSLGRSLLAD